MTTQPAGRTSPRSRRGLATRAKLVRAAREVFERDGFTDARIIDISGAADTAVGSFYTYFTSKQEIFAAVLEQLNEEMLYPRMEPPGEQPAPDVIGQIREMNRAYLSAYRSNARLMAVLEEVALTDADVRAWRLERSHAFWQRTAKSIERLQQQGLADPTIDPVIAARALAAMVGRMAYFVYVLGDHAPSDALVDTLTTLWANALHIQPHQNQNG